MPPQEIRFDIGPQGVRGPIRTEVQHQRRQEAGEVQARHVVGLPPAGTVGGDARPVADARALEHHRVLAEQVADRQLHPAERGALHLAATLAALAARLDPALAPAPQPRAAAFA